MRRVGSASLPPARAPKIRCSSRSCGNAISRRAMDICSALAARKDPFSATSLSRSLQERGGASRADAELLVRILLAPVADATQPADLRRARLAANQPAVDLLSAIGSTHSRIRSSSRALVGWRRSWSPRRARCRPWRAAAITVDRLRASGGNWTRLYGADTGLDLSAAAVGGGISWTRLIVDISDGVSGARPSWTRTAKQRASSRLNSLPNVSRGLPFASHATVGACAAGSCCSLRDPCRPTHARW